MVKKRVLYISNEDFQLGGSSLSLLDMLHALGENVEPILLFRADGVVASFFKEKGYTCIIEPFMRASYHATGLKRVIKFIPHAILRFIRHQKCITHVIKKVGAIDLVHTNSSTVDIGPQIAHKLGVPHVWHLREYYDIGLKSSPFPSWSAWKRKLFRSDAVIAITPGLYHHWNLQTHKNAYCIPDAVCSKSEVQIIQGQRQKVILFVAGAITPLKRPDEAMRVFHASGLSDYSLLLIGSIEPGFKHSLEKLSIDLGIADRIKFQSAVRDVKPAMRTAAAILVCTENEGMGRVAVEAMFSGCPVVARNSGGSRDVLKQGKLGSLYNRIEEGALQLKAIVNDFPINIIIEAQKEAVNSYTIDTYGQKIMKIYSSFPCQQ